MNHRFSDEGLVDYRTVAAQYETTAKLGSAFAAEVIRYVSIIEVNPQGFSRAPRCPRGREIRVVRIGRFDYLLYHEVWIAKSSRWPLSTPNAGRGFGKRENHKGVST